MEIASHLPPFNDIGIPAGVTGDADCVLTGNADGSPVAGCALWWRSAPRHFGERLGCIGRFQAENVAVGKHLLEKALSILREAGCHRAVGPLDGNTWRPYRLVTWSSGEAPFFLEPANPDYYVRCFEESGFRAWARYTSAKLSLGALPASAGMERLSLRLRQRGVHIESLDAERFDAALEAIYELSSTAFSDNFLYTPISKAEFMAMYRRLAPQLDFELICLGYCGTELAGFVFSYPDPQIEKTIIVKTLAVAPQRRFAGLGSLLVHEVQKRAAGKGYLQAIHALQHAGNPSQRITARFSGQRFREYTLYARSCE